MNVSDDASRYSDLAHKISKAFGNSKGGEYCRKAVTPNKKDPHTRSVQPAEQRHDKRGCQQEIEIVSPQIIMP